MKKTGDKSPGQNEKIATTAHLLNTTGHHLAHVQRHLEALKRKQSPAERALNQDHAMIHLKGGLEHVQKVMDHMKSNYPREGAEMTKLESMQPSVSNQLPINKRVAQALRKNKGK